MQNYEVRVGLWAVFHTIMGLDENLGGGGVTCSLGSEITPDSPHDGAPGCGAADGKGGDRG